MNSNKEILQNLISALDNPSLGGFPDYRDHLFKQALQGAKASFAEYLSSNLDELFRGNMKKEAEEFIVNLLSLPEIADWTSHLQVERTIRNSAYIYDLKNRYPQLWNNIGEAICVRFLTQDRSEASKMDLVNTMLALHGHKYFLNKEVALLRISKPFQQGVGSRGKNPKVPQKDGIYFIYNSEEILAKLTTEAVVCKEEKLGFLDVDHTRCRILKRGSLIDSALNFGLYKVTDDDEGEKFLVVKALMPQWQRAFVKFCKNFHKNVAEGLPEEGYLTSQQYAFLVAAAERFVGDRFSAQEFWENFQQQTPFKAFFQGNYFKEYVENLKQGKIGTGVVVGLNALDCISLKQMTVL